MRTRAGNQSSKAANAMGLFPLLFLLLLLPDFSTPCCCSWFPHGFFVCGCNFFGCNCATDTYIDHHGVKRSNMCKCDHNEHCPSRRRKRSLDEPISQAYSELYPRNLIAEAAMENFFSFDLNTELRKLTKLAD